MLSFSECFFLIQTRISICAEHLKIFFKVFLREEGWWVMLNYFVVIYPLPLYLLETKTTKNNKIYSYKYLGQSHKHNINMIIDNNICL